MRIRDYGMRWFAIAGFVVSAGLTPTAIALDNDVSIGSSAGLTQPCAPPICNVRVVGAPRLVPDIRSNAASIALHLSIASPAVFAARTLQVNVLDAQTFEPLLTLVAPEQLANLAERTILLSEFSDFGTLAAFDGGLGDRDVILTVGGFFVFDFGGATAPTLTITVTGHGEQVIADKVGDSNTVADDLSDVPPRSIELIRTLGRFTSSGKGRSAELDEGGTKRVVGYTHAFVPPGDRIDGAILHLSVSGNRRTSADFILLDGGRGQRGKAHDAAVIFLCNVPGADALPSSTPIALDINLAEAPVTVDPERHPCASPPTPTNVLDLLRDGRLNVIVGDDTAVDFSTLRITLEEPTAP